TAHDHVRGALVGTRLVTLGRYAPRGNRVTTTGGAAFTTTVRMVDGVHYHTANGRTNTAPAHCTGFTDGAQVVLAVRHFAQGGAALGGHLAHFTGAQAQGDVLTFTGYQLDAGAGAACHLGTFAGLHFHAVYGAAKRNVAQRQAVAGLDRSLGAAHQLVTYGDLGRCNHVTALAVRVQQQGDVSRAVRIVFQAFNDGRNAILVATKIDHAVFL